MKIIPTVIPDLILIEPKVSEDPRGFFMETFREDWLEKLGIKHTFVQDNHSKSTQGVLRGLHFQKPPYEQAKLVRVIQGEVLDVAVDLRRGSPTFGKAAVEILSDKNKRMLYIPKGFAHGFCVISKTCEFLYKVSDYYAPQAESGIIWNDPDFGIEWPKLDVPYILSDKDRKYPTFRDWLTQA
ncbi:MAG TPA: dTDP-4-dehydrorhamnose 3,5-epimerase [Candidatus Omnitrophota bacterium]|nr:dTDP-4-dehydrorhamnose 3,5-epimerase [Candidatus Omnitrophota bacterium]